MKINHQLTQTWRNRLRICAAAFCLLAGVSVSTALAQSSVEKSETSQQAKQTEDELARARMAVAKPNDKPEPPETGRIIGNYSVTSSMELGYRFVDTNGNVNRYYSDVNVRDGFRVLDYSLDARSISGTGALFDFLRADVSNAGGDQSQYFSLRADKTRVYKFDATVRRLYYFRAFLPTTAANAQTFANNQHNYDLRQQVSDFNLKLFPQRKVRVNLAYGRSVARGPFTNTYDYERDEFLINGRDRWETNDYRAGIDFTHHGWDFFAEQMYRSFRNDTEYFQNTAPNPGNNATNSSVLTFFERDSPTRSHALVTRGSLRGNITPRLHLVLRGLHGDERLKVTQFDQTAGTDASNRKILSRNIVATGNVKRPSATADAVLTYDLAEHFSVSNSFRYTSYRILGDVGTLTASTLQPQGTVAPLTNTFDDRYIDVSSYWNTLQFQFSLGTKFSANAGWRGTHRDVTLRSPVLTGSPNTTPLIVNGVEQFTEDKDSQNTNTFIGGVRFRPLKRANFFFDYENGTSDNAFVRINPLEFQRARVRANIQVTNKLSFNSTFTATDRTNPTRFVENDANFRAFSLSVFWEPNQRVWVNGGYDHDRVSSSANIAFFINNALNQGRSLYYARQNFVFVDSRFAITKRLDVLMVYRYVQDRGAPSSVVATGPNDFIASLPLKRHNPEARVAFRFNNHVTGNISYRHYSYNERFLSAQDYRSNIVTTSLRLTY